uniref:Uncharacterized protein n=1 Tax=Clastoptera arizonana TaxID=38151 RepID=A0A1B6DE42_9HEMI
MENIYKFQKTNVYGVCEEEMTNYDESKCVFFWDYLTPFTRFWGIFTSIVLCGVGVDISMHHYTEGYYLIIGSIIVFVFEIAWAVTLFLQVCLKNENSMVYKGWDIVLWCRLWKRSLLYMFFATYLFLKPHRLWLSLVSGK